MTHAESGPGRLAKKRLSVCREEVKEPDGTRRKCNVELSSEGARCPLRERHLLPFPTGYCSNGWCEGVKAKSSSGKPAPTCRETVRCPCACHAEFDRMFSMTGVERRAVENSGYSPERGDFKMPSLEERAALRVTSRATPDRPALIIESPLPGAVPARLGRDYAPTASGRAARGQLEYRVHVVCDSWVMEKSLEYCTPGFVSEQIAIEFSVQPPSQGAVDAIFKRWEALGFALILRKPTRFAGYTAEGAKQGLEGLKLLAKQSKKNLTSSTGRTLLK